VCCLDFGLIGGAGRRRVAIVNEVLVGSDPLLDCYSFSDIDIVIILVVSILPDFSGRWHFKYNYIAFIDKDQFCDSHLLIEF